jgi:hypothetical protein
MELDFLESGDLDNLWDGLNDAQFVEAPSNNASNTFEHYYVDDFLKQEQEEDSIEKFCESLPDLNDFVMETSEPDFAQLNIANKNIIDMDNTEFREFIKLKAPYITSEETIQNILEAKDKVLNTYATNVHKLETLIAHIDSVSGQNPNVRKVAHSRILSGKISMKVNCHSRMVSFIEKVQDTNKTTTRSPTSKGKNKHLPQETKTILMTWFLEHADKPYPDKQTKEELARKTNLTVKQVGSWFINQRSRALKSK